MEPKVFEEIGKHYKHEVIEFDWEPVRKQPKRFAILYPIIGYIVSLLAIILIGLGVFMWLFLIVGSIFFFGGIFCANGIIGESTKKGRRFLKSLMALRKQTFHETFKSGLSNISLKGG